MKLRRGMIAAVIGIVLILVLAVLWKIRQPEVHVIGEDFAKADAAEQQRKQKGSGPSPMPAAKYDVWRGEEELVNPSKNALDDQLTELCKRFTQSDARARAEMRSSISMEEFYTLLSYSRRSAVFALRERNTNWIRNGLTAIAMMEAERTDFRDILISLGLLYHSAKRAGGDADQLLRDAAKLSEPNVSSLLTEYIERSPQDKDLRSAWGYDEVETKDGLGFIGWGFADYRPSYDLKKVVLEIADVIAKDKYLPSSASIAEDLPAIWLNPKANGSVEQILKQVRAGGSIYGKLRPNEHAKYESQVLMVFLVEMDDANSAQQLLEISSKERPKSYSMIGVAEGRLFCLVVGRSVEQGVESFETPESLPRFTKGVSEILKKYSKPR